MKWFILPALFLSQSARATCSFTPSPQFLDDQRRVAYEASREMYHAGKAEDFAQKVAKEGWDSTTQEGVKLAAASRNGDEAAYVAINGTKDGKAFEAKGRFYGSDENNLYLMRNGETVAVPRQGTKIESFAVEGRDGYISTSTRISDLPDGAKVRAKMDWDVSDSRHEWEMLAKREKDGLTELTRDGEKIVIAREYETYQIGTERGGRSATRESFEEVYRKSNGSNLEIQQRSLNATMKGDMDASVRQAIEKPNAIYQGAEVTYQIPNAKGVLEKSTGKFFESNSEGVVFLQSVGGSTYKTTVPWNKLKSVEVQESWIPFRTYVDGAGSLR